MQKGRAINIILPLDLGMEKNNKHIFLQIGGNWCPWCIKFHNFVEADSEIKNFFGDNFEVVKVNYDRENKQEKLFKKHLKNTLFMLQVWKK